MLFDYLKLLLREAPAFARERHFSIRPFQATAAISRGERLSSYIRCGQHRHTDRDTNRPPQAASAAVAAEEEK